MASTGKEKAVVRITADLDLNQWIDNAQLGEVIADELQRAVRREIAAMAKEAMAGMRPSWMRAIAAKMEEAIQKV